ncbi:MAG: asparagine--tRNA ligase, partial [Spirochaetia bacterium]|nr:asparagine--tRNA ligase [Spirochaetia bacterium]
MLARRRVADLLKSPSADFDVLIKGWVRTRRDSKGGFSFLEINDGSCLANVQVVADKHLSNYEHEVLKLHPGSSLAVEGRLVRSQGKNQSLEIQASGIRVYGFCDPESYPIQKKEISFEKLRELAHLRPRTQTFGAVYRLRHVLAAAVHDFFRSRGFLWVHTPIITASDCEGAGAMFRVTTLDLPNAKFSRTPEGRVDFREDFFGRESYLTVSGQLEGETGACALGNIYTFGPTFRAENSNTPRHLAEFWMIEPEMAFAELSDDMDLAEDFLKFLVNAALAHSPDDLAFLNEKVEPNLLSSLRQISEKSFVRITYTEAVKILAESGAAFSFPVKWGGDLQTEHERFLTEVHFKGPGIVTHYTREIKSFSMKQNPDGKTVAAMDVLFPRIGEIIGGSQREDDLAKLETRMGES